jgi:hypothetical protein
MGFSARLPSDSYSTQLSQNRLPKKTRSLSRATYQLAPGRWSRAVATVTVRVSDRRDAPPAGRAPLELARPAVRPSPLPQAESESECQRQGR